MAERFISPFLPSESAGAEENGDPSQLVIPDAALFNDSLDEEVDPEALLQSTNLPTECAAAEPQPDFNHPSESQRELDDSLDLDETQLPDDTLERAGNECSVPNDDSMDNDKPSPRMNSVSGGKKIELSSQEKEPVTTESSCKAAGVKVRPSFGKKKKGFAPPKVAQKLPTSCQSDSSPVPDNTCTSSDQSISDACDKTSPQESASAPIPTVSSRDQTQDKSSDTDCDLIPVVDISSTVENTKKMASKKMTQDQRKKEREQKEHERVLKKQDKEKKRLEREKKKAELERQRNEKRLELERKKAEREQKKMEKELKKIEREQKKAEKQAKTSPKKQKIKEKTNTASGGDDIVSNKNEAEPSKEPLKSHRLEQEPKVSSETEVEMEDSAPQQVNKVVVKEDEEIENIPPSKVQSSSKDDIATEHHSLEKPVKDTALPMADHPTEVKKQSKKKFSPPKSKTEASASSKVIKKQKREADKESKGNKFSEKCMSKKVQSVKGKKRKAAFHSDSESEPEPKRSKPANYHGPVWVQCENSSCKKWRLLSDCDDPAKVPANWVCSMNTNLDYNTCSAGEEQWSEGDDSQEFVESPYIPGSIVWSKMDGYPWWPAMVEEDPNEETYYEMGYRDDPIPVRYHVVFFDTPVCRAWVSSLHTLPYTDQNDPNKEAKINVPQKQRRSLVEGKKQAKKALSLSAKERLEVFSFAKRFHHSRTDKRKKRAFIEEDSPEVIPSQSKCGGSGAGGRKSARLMSTEESIMPMSVSLKSKHKQHLSEVVASTSIEEGKHSGLLHQHQHEE